jgi:hypothetical protein
VGHEEVDNQFLNLLGVRLAFGLFERMAAAMNDYKGRWNTGSDEGAVEFMGLGDRHDPVIVSVNNEKRRVVG